MCGEFSGKVIEIGNPLIFQFQLLSSYSCTFQSLNLKYKPPAYSSTEQQQNISVNWYQVTGSDTVKLLEKGVRIEIHHPFSVKNLTWHYKGDYFSSPKEGSRPVKIHQKEKLNHHLERIYTDSEKPKKVKNF
ncbi:hypothetical protein DDB_G0278251 [Dictyostelium discoideum AX4]|uniref:Uncharacterized protein n=1 Tax=Dictyostelium discoideum TaxID=44689 RepID=Q54YG1_DICDI|nr:hypothetical protein DDB_G0278251 [Dictyostelium discoideum AX4]EAL68298.1 hypothetical protein DDB_G0278251 [Dictyostelium discoideum AX4]|eukprot:XP_642241.1 hypothetical protein DDB_G0278251 [Dictyostelium discoideum AX4]